MSNKIKLFRESEVWYVKHLTFVFPFHDGDLDPAKLNAAMIILGGKKVKTNEWSIEYDALKVANFLNRVFRDSDPHAAEKWVQEHCLSRIISEQQMPWDEFGQVNWFELEEKMHDLIKTHFPLCMARSVSR